MSLRGQSLYKRWQRAISARILASHIRAREQILVLAPVPTTRHGQQPMPVPAIRGQGSPAGMPVCPPAGQQGRRSAGTSDEDGGQLRRAKSRRGRWSSGLATRKAVAWEVNEDGGRIEEDSSPSSGGRAAVAPARGDSVEAGVGDSVEASVRRPALETRWRPASGGQRWGAANGDLGEARDASGGRWPAVWSFGVAGMVA
jgi:hypothetical protein